jgi:hypothetical protein
MDMLNVVFQEERTTIEELKKEIEQRKEKENIWMFYKSIFTTRVLCALSLVIKIADRIHKITKDKVVSCRKK